MGDDASYQHQLFNTNTLYHLLVNTACLAALHGPMRLNQAISTELCVGSAVHCEATDLMFIHMDLSASVSTTALAAGWS